MKKGFLIGGGLIVAGLMLQMCVGPVKWSVFTWPVNGVVLGGFLTVIVIVFLLRKRVSIFNYLSTQEAAIPALAYTVAMMVIMGVTRQKEDGTWLNNMLTFWLFVLTYIYMAMILGMTVLKRLGKLRNSHSLRDISFLLNHCGLFIVMTAATMGNADMQRLKMMLMEGQPESRALTQDKMVQRLPMSIELKRFVMETYDDGMPRRYASELEIRTLSGEHMLTTVEVNKPVEVEGWRIYQYGYDTQMGAASNTSVLELVSDPWLPLVYVGIFMIMTGTLLLLTYTRWNYKRLLPTVILTVLALCIVSYFMPVIRSTNLVPVLRSPWFMPHILVYIVCYSLMGVAAVMAVAALVFGKKALYNQLDTLVIVGFVFMTFGIMFGAFWAKEAWGEYWSWDPKETWAAITWFAYLIYIHYRQMPNHNPRLALWLTIGAFALLQMCWWGINYLPAAQGASIHVY